MPATILDIFDATARAQSDRPAMARKRPKRKPAATRQLGTHPQLRRLMWALSRLRFGQPLKATDLAREFEVNVRTAYRDIDFLRDEWRVPLECRFSPWESAAAPGPPRPRNAHRPSAAWLPSGSRSLQSTGRSRGWVAPCA